MTLAATFLGGAKSRLLPPSVPFRFFAAAALFHVLMWLAMLAAAWQLTSFRGGLGPALAALHVLTLGVLTMSAIGASAQLLPVATRRAFAAVWPLKLIFWLLVPGLLTLLAGMWEPHVPALIVGAGVTTSALLLFAVLLADNLRRAGSLGVVAAYGWAAVASLISLVALGLVLAVDYRVGIITNHGGVALAHLILGGFGFMGLLVVGFSHVLVPMFSLSSLPPRRGSFAGFALALAAIVLGCLGALSGNQEALTMAGGIALGAVCLHLWLMLRSLATGMRKRLGLSFVLVKAAWVALPVTLLVGLAALHGLAGPNGATLFGFLLVGGWLLTFLFGIMQRIMPFLASMHAVRAPGIAPPLLSELAASGPLKLHAICHGVALALIALAIAIDDVTIARAGSVAGLIGAVAFAWFTADILRRIVSPRRVSAVPA